MALDVTDKHARLVSSLRLSPGPLAAAFASAQPAAQRAAAGLFRRDPHAWTTDASVSKSIANRLGWLTSPELMFQSLARLKQFSAGVVADGVTDVVLLGMGGSSLAPEVLRAVLGTAPGHPRLHMLDSTDPASVRAASTTPAHTLYLISSKSGTTIEPNVLAAYFEQELKNAGVRDWPRHFVAITDGGTALETRAREVGFRDVFVNPSDIGGRYSALSFFGLVPAALMGQDIDSLVGWGLAMLSTAQTETVDAAANPAVALGLAIGASARAGRDKMTLVVPPALEPFGLWVEQLIAESTGKHGVGVVPIAGEPPTDASHYGTDRLFVRVTPKGATLDAPQINDAPRVEIELVEMPALGAEFVRWEIATAVAGALLEINPFDEPNVQQAKDATRVLLDRVQREGKLPATTTDRTLSNGVTLSLSDAARIARTPADPDAFLSLLKPGDYFAILAYLGPDSALLHELQALRRDVRDRARVATMFGYGPRYLHSTGQLHKGGPNSGVFLLVTADPVADLAIPGQPFSFGTLEHAQALGDFQSLGVTGRRALFVHLPKPDAALLHDVSARLLAGLR